MPKQAIIALPYQLGQFETTRQLLKRELTSVQKEALQLAESLSDIRIIRERPHYKEFFALAFLFLLLDANNLIEPGTDALSPAFRDILDIARQLIVREAQTAC